MMCVCLSHNISVDDRLLNSNEFEEKRLLFHSFIITVINIRYSQAFFKPIKIT